MRFSNSLTFRKATREAFSYNVGIPRQRWLMSSGKRTFRGNQFLHNNQGRAEICPVDWGETYYF